MKFKKIIFIFTFLFIVLSSLTFAELIEEQQVSSDWIPMWHTDPNVAICQNITTPDTSSFNSFTFEIRTHNVGGSRTGTCWLSLYSDSSDSRGALIANSTTTVLCESLNTIAGDVNFSFSPAVELEQNTKYYICGGYTGMSAGNYVYVDTAITNPYPKGMAAHFDGTPYGLNLRDLVFRYYGENSTIGVSSDFKLSNSPVKTPFSLSIFLLSLL